MFGVIKKIKPTRLDSLCTVHCGEKGVNSRRILIVFYAYLWRHSALNENQLEVHLNWKWTNSNKSALAQWVETVYYIAYFMYVLYTLDLKPAQSWTTELDIFSKA